MVPRSFFASEDDEAAFVEELKARIAEITPAPDAAVFKS